jgi:hypothetical protein
MPPGVALGLRETERVVEEARGRLSERPRGLLHPRDELFLAAFLERADDRVDRIG